MRNKRQVVLLLAGLTSFGVMAGCGGGGGEGGEVKIALLAPKTTPPAPPASLQGVGESFVRVFNVAVDAINDKGGINGQRLVGVISDTGGNETVAMNQLRDLVENQGVIAVVGPARSAEVKAAFPIAKELEVPIISPSSTSHDLSSADDGGFMFRNVPDDNIQSIAMAHYMSQPAPSGLGVTSAVIIHERGAYGDGLKGSFTAAFSHFGGTVESEVAYDTDLDTDAKVQAVVDQLNAIDPAPTMVVLIALEQDGLKIVNKWAMSGQPPGLKWFMTDGARSGNFLRDAPTQMKDMCGTASTFPVSGLAYVALKSAYEAVNNDTLEDQVYAPNVWDAVHLFAAAMVQQQHDDAGAPLGGGGLRDALSKVSKDGQVLRAEEWRTLIGQIRNGADIDYDGAAGPNDFDQQGQAIGPFEVWCIDINESSSTRTFRQARFYETAEIESLIQ